MTQPAVVLSVEWRRRIGFWIHERLTGLIAEIISIAVSGQHVHFQARMPKPMPRKWTGLAKKHAWHEAVERGWTGELWAKRSKATPINDRKHQENVFHYVLRHKEEGAWVWSFRDPPPTLDEQECPPVATGGL